MASPWYWGKSEFLGNMRSVLKRESENRVYVYNYKLYKLSSISREGFGSVQHNWDLTKIPIVGGLGCKCGENFPSNPFLQERPWELMSCICSKLLNESHYFHRWEWPQIYSKGPSCRFKSINQYACNLLYLDAQVQPPYPTRLAKIIVFPNLYFKNSKWAKILSSDLNGIEVVLLCIAQCSSPFHKRWTRFSSLQPLWR